MTRNLNVHPYDENERAVLPHLDYAELVGKNAEDLEPERNPMYIDRRVETVLGHRHTEINPSKDLVELLEKVMERKGLDSDGPYKITGSKEEWREVFQEFKPDNDCYYVMKVILEDKIDQIVLEERNYL